MEGGRRQGAHRLKYRRDLTIDPVEAPAMRLPRVRFTVRRMMVAVAIVGLLLWQVASMLQSRPIPAWLSFSALAHVG